MTWSVAPTGTTVFETMVNNLKIRLYIMVDFEVIEAWIGIDGYGTIELMFGMSRKDVSREDFIELAKASVFNHFQEYIKEIKGDM